MIYGETRYVHNVDVDNVDSTTKEQVANEWKTNPLCDPHKDYVVVWEQEALRWYIAEIEAI